jgi:hypothetical protein
MVSDLTKLHAQTRSAELQGVCVETMESIVFRSPMWPPSKGRQR